MSNGVNDVLDVAIVGGGVSGVYSAWRLMRDSGPATFGNGGGRPKITVFEGSERIGGRMLSVTPPGMPNTVCELGGMRFMSRHVIVASLVQYFNLATAPFPVYEAENIAYLRGKVLRLPDLNNPSALPYNLTDVEKSVVANTSTSILLYALQQIVPNCLSISYDDLCLEVQTATFEGKPLRHYGFWNLLARILSPDAYAFARDSCGYDVIVSNTNAADAILFILSDFGPNVTYSRCVNGYDQIPHRLAAEFQAAGGDVVLGKWLQSFDSATLPDGSSGVSLCFRDGSTVLARNLVLAMPYRSIELLDHSGSVLDNSRTEVWDLINSVYPIPMFKIFLAYHYPWWQPVGPTQGRTLTDLPIRQCYYWGVEPSSTNANAPGNSVLLASYDDENSTSFWAGLRKKSALTEYYQPTAADETDPGTWGGHRAPREMADEAHRQIVQMHGVSYAPKPYAAAYRDWAEDPYGGGINVWQIHVDSWSVAPKILNPRPGVPVYICGEAYSHEQGWVEGALQTAENLVTQYFGLPTHVPPQPVVAPPNPLPGTRVGARVK